MGEEAVAAQASPGCSRLLLGENYSLPNISVLKKKKSVNIAYCVSVQCGMAEAFPAPLMWYWRIGEASRLMWKGEPTTLKPLARSPCEMEEMQL